MARKGIAILREINMVKASEMTPGIKARMLHELTEELAALYAPADAEKQLKLPVDVVQEVRKK